MNLDSLKNWFARLRTSHDGSVQKQIRHKQQEITRLLEQYQQAEQLVMLTPPTRVGAQHSEFNTGILSVDATKGQFLIDQPQPESSLESLEPGARITFSLTHQGIRCEFTAELLEVVDFPEGNRYLFNYPDGITQTQLRDAFRVKITGGTPVRVVLTTPNEETLHGVAVDLSSSGARIRIEGLATPQPHRGDCYRECLLILADGNQVQSEAQLMHWQFLPKHNHTLLGIQLTGLNASTQRNINRFLIDLQRRESRFVDRG